MSKPRLGGSVLKDPSGTRRLILKLEKALAIKFRAAKDELHRIADNPQDINAQVDKVAADVLHSAAPLVEKAARDAQVAAAIRTSHFLAAIGIAPRGQTREMAEPEIHVDPNILAILQQRNLAALKGITDEMAKRIKDELTAGILAGESTYYLSRRIDEAVEDIGVTRATTMARTETMFAYNTAAKADYAANGVAEVEWLVAQDDRLCDQCAPLQGQRFQIGSAPDCPKHPSCRCILLPVIPEVK